ncbi:MAG: proprotein convertase P-domain-containing protein [Saprospiraceae bacterium]
MKRILTSRLTWLVTMWLFLSSITNSNAQRPPMPPFGMDHGQVALNNSPNQVPCEIVCPGDLNFVLAPGACDMVVNYTVQTTGDCLPSVVVQTSGLPSGSAFPIGVTQNCFSIDLPPLGLPDGDTTCCFNVTVNGFPNPIFSLVCNDLVFISLNENCQYCIGAGEVLEGGPYACYDNYIVELDKTPPYGNGPWVSPCVGLSDINKTYQVRITDPATANKCWGNVKIEDKISPVLECHDISVPCNANANINAEPFPAITGYQKITYTGLQEPIGENGAPTPDIHVYNFDYSYLPAGTAALDVNCRIKLTGHTWLPDLRIVVTAPDGTMAGLFSQGGCTGIDWPINVLLDDEGAGNITQCTELDANGNAIQCMDQGNSVPMVLTAFDGKNASGVWTVTISDISSGDDGLIEIVGLEILVNVPSKSPIDNCGGTVSLTHTDTETVGDCASGLSKTIHRLWKATDASGNSSTCIQNIKHLRGKLTDVVLPSDYNDIAAPSFSCTEAAYPSPEWIADQNLQGEPLLFGLPEGCNIVWGYEDLRINVCDGTYKINRTWTLVDFCTSEVLEHNQIIKVIDEQGPVFTCPENLSVSTDPFACCATVNLPDVILADGCSKIQAISGIISLFDPITGQQTGVENIAGTLANFPGNDPADPDTLGAFGFTPCLPPGPQIVAYLVEDNCGNTATCSFSLSVKDYTPPVAVCDEITTVAIGVDDPFDCFGPAGPGGDPAALDACHFGGVSWVKAVTFDDGSYDACANLKFTIRRMGPYSDCILGLNSTNGNLPCGDIFPDFPSEFERAVSESDSIKFYCCEAGTIQPVIMRVYQLDANGNIAPGPNGVPIYNECAIQVQVEDKIKPVCISPANVSVTCEQFDPSLSAYGKASVIDNCCLDATINYQGQCGLGHNVNYSNFDTICNEGTIVRNFRANDCYGNTSQCTQRIVVNYEQDYYVRFPNDVLVTNCDGTGIYGEPTFFGEDCELLASSYSDEVFLVVPDACRKIERTWTIINWCTYNPVTPPINVPNPNPNAIVNHPSNLPGPIVSDCNALAPWNATIVKINPTDPAATNYCTFWNANANAYRYTQIIKIIDSKDPEISNCPAAPVTVIDSSLNNPDLWHNVFNPSLPIQDLKEGRINLSITSSDACDGGNLFDMEFLLFLDLDNDGIFETVVNSENLPGADTIRYNNINTPGYLGGTPVTFDSRPVPIDQKWHFALQRNSSSNDAIASVRWNTALQPNTFVQPQLPQGTHKIRWFVTDQCGNQEVCEHGFTIEQGPTSGITDIEGDGFALFQNEPNPFSQSTKIGFNLPNSADATLSVFDAEGRLLFSKTDHFSQGYNAVPLEGSLLPASSVLFYKLESGSNVAWKKMVLIR